MTRMTRAKAAEVAEKVQVHQDSNVLDTISEAREIADITSPAGSEGEQRAALGEIAPNSANNKQVEDETEADNKILFKGKNRHHKKTNGCQRETDVPGASGSEPLHGVLPDDDDSAPSPASQAAASDLSKDVPELEMSHLPVHDIRPNSPPSEAVRLTRSQLRDLELHDETNQPPSNVSTEDPVKDSPATTTVQEVPSDVSAQLAEQKTSSEASPTASTMPNTRQSTQGAVPAGPSTPGKAYDELEAAAVEAQTTPPGSEKALSPRATGRDSIAALDDLDDAVEKVTAAMPEVQPSPQKKSKAKKPGPTVRTTKASQARISLAHGPKDSAKPPAWGRPRPSVSAADKRAVSFSSSSEHSNGEAVEESKRHSIIPHSKPRPVSMSFPTPPPPPKSRKAPTKPTFQLPGEVVAAKLKAAREARLQQESEEAKKPAFKARPAPSMNRAPVVRQTSASKARESLMGGKAPASQPTLARANSVATSRPTMGNRPTAAKPGPPTTAASKRHSVAQAPAAKPPSRPSTSMSKPAAPAARKPRPASMIVPSSTGASRPQPSSTILSSSGSGSGTSKGKEVFNRAAQAKSAAEQEKREKEEAAKRARAEAAERSRQLSREWAEKQRVKKMGVKPEVKAKEDAVDATKK